MDHVDDIGLNTLIEPNQMLFYLRIEILVKQTVRVILIEENPVHGQIIISVINHREFGGSIRARLVANDLDLVSRFPQRAS